MSRSMRFSCPREVLYQGLQTVQRAVPSRSTMPILSGILLEVRQGFLRLVATDLELGIEVLLPVEVEAEGRTVLEARYLSEIVRRLPEGAPVAVEVEEGGGSAQLKAARVKYALRVMSAEDYPELPQLEGERLWKAKESDLRRMIRETSFAVAVEETRPFLTGVLLEMRGGEVAMAATDTSRLAVSKRGTLPGELEERLIVPVRSLNEVSRNLDEEGEREVLVSWTSSQIQFKLPSLRLVSRLIDGQFPNYQQVIPSNYAVRLEVSRGELLSAIERVSVLAQGGTSVVQVDVKDGGIVLSAESEVGRAEEEVAAAVEGEAMEISFNSRFLTDVLRVLECGAVGLEFTGQYSPAVVKPLGDPAYQYIVMPIRLR
ncbi:MAG: DNA polymerase III subunit beta [Bacillota bacterium]|nr:DNA polymerase III subunit beta [Bacillota bacterium]